MYTMKIGAIPTGEQLIELYASVGWRAYTGQPRRLLRAVEKSHQVFTVWQGEELVALLRTVGDGETIVYIQDLLVKPEHQRQGLGRWLLGEFQENNFDIRQKVLLTDGVEENIAFYHSCGWQNAAERGIAAFVDL